MTGDKIANAVITFDKLASGAIATQEQAQQGTLDNVLMTPLKVAQAIAMQIPPAVPTGMVAFFDLTEVPDGWLVCDGSAVSRTTYANLFAKIGTRHGAGDGSTTFNLPDMDARFLEGTTDTGQVGTSVEAGLPNITGSPGRLVGYSSEEASGCFTRSNTGAAELSPGYGITSAELGFQANLSSAIYGGSAVVQPSSLIALACIKL